MPATHPTLKEKVLVNSSINKLVTKKSNAGGFGRRSDSLYLRQHIRMRDLAGHSHRLGEVGLAHNEHIHTLDPRNLIEVI